MQDQALVQQQNLWLDHMTFLTSLRDALGAATVIQALYATAEKEWANMFDVNDPDTHLIKGVFVSSRKTDVVRVYISKLIAQYMRSTGVRATAWSKATIASDNDTNVAISNRISAMEFQANYDLFKIVATRLIGLDDSLVDLAVIDDVKEQARHLVAYMAQRFDMADNFEDALAKYPASVMYFEELLDGQLFNSHYFDRLALNISNYPHPKVKPDFLDMLEVFDKYWINVIIDEADPHPNTTVQLLADKGYETVSVTGPNGERFFRRGGKDHVLGGLHGEVNPIQVLKEQEQVVIGGEGGRAGRPWIRLEDFTPAAVDQIGDELADAMRGPSLTLPVGSEEDQARNALAIILGDVPADMDVVAVLDDIRKKFMAGVMIEELVIEGDHSVHTGVDVLKHLGGVEELHTSEDPQKSQ